MNLQQSEEIIEKIKNWYLSEIRSSAPDGLERLSIKMGYSPKYLFSLVNRRQSFSALRRVVKKLKLK